MNRRSLIGAAALAPLLALPGCATTGGGFDLAEAVRRLLGLSAQRAFASLLAENGFYDSQVARIQLPDQLGGRQAMSILSAILQSTAFRDRLARSLNRAAERGAALAAPVVTDVILGMPIRDVIGIVRGGPSAATTLLEGALGDRLITTMLPGVGEGLRLFDSAIVQQALRAATSIDLAGLREDVTRKASEGIYRAIAREEAAIRANPQATGDPLIAAVFGLSRR